MAIKYIVGLALDNPDNRRLEAILFSDTLAHKDAAVLFGFGVDVVSAGFVQLGVGTDPNRPNDGSVYNPMRTTAYTYGESESLKIGGHPFDDYYVQRALGLVPHDESRQKADYEKGLEIIDARREKPRNPHPRHSSD